MSRKGVQATNFVLASPTCSPSRGALLTGRYPTRYNIPYPLGPGSSMGLPQSETTIARLLKQANYKTKMIGKWHLGDQPEHLPRRHGFDEYYGLLYSHDFRNPYVKTDTTIKLFRNEAPEVFKPEDTSLTALYSDEAIRYIEQQDKRNPFFLYLAYNMPHLPVYQQAQRARYDGSKGGELGSVIQEMDAGIEKIWQALEKQGLAENTIFIFTSDNGPWSEYPQRMSDDGFTTRNHAGYSGIFRGSKASTYEGGVRVPFIVYWKDHTQQKVLKELVSGVDVFPTLANWAGASPATELVLDGQDVGELFTEKDARLQHRAIYYVHSHQPEVVREGDWKLRRVSQEGKDTIELFNLAEDPAERVNLVEDKPEIYQRLLEALNNFPGMEGSD